MELVYLWVEDYKNIHNQGFNFSPRYHCDYNPETNELTIDNRDDYIPNFFGKNINVTAIVGKNGSGKSNIAECIALNQSTEIVYPNKAIFLIYYDKIDNKFLKYLKNIEDVKCKEFEIYKLADMYNNESPPKKRNLFKIFYTSSKTWFDPKIQKKQEHSKNIIYEIDISDYTLFQLYVYKIREDYHHRLKSFTQLWFFARTQNTLNGLKLFKSNIKFPRDFSKPKSFYITINRSFIQTKYVEFINKKGGIFEQWRSLGIIYDFNNNEYQLKHLLFQYISSLKKLEEGDIIIDFKGLNYNEFKDKGIEWFKEKIDDGWDKLIKKYGLAEYELDKLINYLSTRERFDIEKDFKDIQEILDIYGRFLNYGKIDFLSLRYDPLLPSGMEQLINLISRVYMQIEKIKMESHDKFILLVLDEPDIYLHPNWQKQFISILISFLEKNYQDIKFHLIFTTHSPFLLSDIPKQNIIFLDVYNEEESRKKYPNLNFNKFENGYCINVSNEIDIKPFGANIHTLLGDGFFMDGLMGEFAKGKINNVIKFLKGDKSNIKDKDEAKKMIEMIGEPFLKQKLEQMYAKKFNEDMIDIKIKLLKEEIERLKNVKDRQKT